MSQINAHTAHIKSYHAYKSYHTKYNESCRKSIRIPQIFTCHVEYKWAYHTSHTQKRFHVRWGARQAPGLLPRSRRAPLAVSQSPYEQFHINHFLKKTHCLQKNLGWAWIYRYMYMEWLEWLNPGLWAQNMFVDWSDDANEAHETIHLRKKKLKKLVPNKKKGQRKWTYSW